MPKRSPDLIVGLFLLALAAWVGLWVWYLVEAL